MTTTEPTVTGPDRESLIAWLEWNDPQGCYADAECRDEGLEPLTLMELLALFVEQAGEGGH